VELLHCAAMASGSAFPILPLIPVKIPCQPGLEKGQKESYGKVFIADGGYTHNLPLAIAEKAGAKAVLAINATPYCTNNATALPSSSQVPMYGLRLMNFLWNRAQESDRVSMHDMTVVEFAPPEALCNPPFLLDFRDSVIEHYADETDKAIAAHKDIAIVRSWGPPEFRVIEGEAR
jgi:hypothetical protein